MNWIDGCTVMDVNWHPGTTQPVDDGLRRETLRMIRDYRHPAFKHIGKVGLEILRVIEDNMPAVAYIDQVQSSHIFEAVALMDRSVQQKVITRLVDWLKLYQSK
jgi:hypothetical protein